MDKMRNYNFHIPVMGTGFTLNTPLKVAHLGITSVVSIVDDFLLEKMRKFYCQNSNINYQPITTNNKDYRAQRITSFLNTLNNLVNNKVDEFKENIRNKSKELNEYIELLPDISELKTSFLSQIKDNTFIAETKDWLIKNIPVGDIDVNIMTKLDKQNSFKGDILPTEYNDAHAALRGFANSNLHSSLVLSAGMNPMLYGYLEKFDDFYPDKNGSFNKKITLKVSDYRSALIQGKYLAKKGIWISEFRIESGLNCGGHAFASDGALLGPILQEFKDHREELQLVLFELLKTALTNKKRTVPTSNLTFKISAQGGVGTADEHNFLLNYYTLNSVGWGTPFLLVPEVCDIDESTLQRLEKATEDDLFLSYASPLGVRFNNIKDDYSCNKGAKCNKHLMLSNTEFTKKPICTASEQYFRLKKNALLQQNLSSELFQKEIDILQQKTCLCNGLAQTIHTVNNIETNSKANAICPGPNLAYFNKKVSLKQMIGHIYNRIDLTDKKNRPHLFIKELSLYIDYFKEQLDNATAPTPKDRKNWKRFQKNLLSGIEYYKNLPSIFYRKFEYLTHQFYNTLENMEVEVKNLL